MKIQKENDNSTSLLELTPFPRRDRQGMDGEIGFE